MGIALYASGPNHDRPHPRALPLEFFSVRLVSISTFPLDILPYSLPFSDSPACACMHALSMRLARSLAPAASPLAFQCHSRVRDIAPSAARYEHMIALTIGPDVSRQIMTIPCGPSQARNDSNNSDPGRTIVRRAAWCWNGEPATTAMRGCIAFIDTAEESIDARFVSGAWGELL